MKRYSTEPRTRKYIKGYRFFSFQEIFLINMEKKLLDTTAKTGLHALKRVCYIMCPTCSYSLRASCPMCFSALRTSCSTGSRVSPVSCPMCSHA